MRKKHVIWISLASLLFLLFMTSCTSSVDTDLSFTDSFEGKRVITCTLDKSLGEDKLRTIEALIADNCPPELGYTLSDAQGMRSAVFTLAFTSEEVYAQKTAAILGRTPDIALRRMDTIFCKGVSYREDFTSGDLLAWLQRAVEQQGIVQAGQSIWTLSKPTLTFGGMQYTSKTDKLEVADVTEHPVGEIEVLTTIRADGSFFRQIIVVFPQKTADALGQSLDDYMERLSFDMDSTLISGGEKEYMMRIEASNSDQLLAETRTALDSDKSTLAYEKDVDNSTSFVDQSVWAEQLDFSAFLTGSGKVPVTYKLSAEQPSTLVSAKILQGEEYVDAPGFEPIGFTQQGETDLVDVRLVVRRQALLVHGVSIETNRNGVWGRSVIVQFEQGSGEQEAGQLKEYVEGLGIETVTVRTDKENYPLTEIQLKGGTLSDLEEGMKTLFGEGCSLQGSENRLFISPVHTAQWTEVIDTKEFLGEIGYTGPVYYFLDAKGQVAVRIDQTTETEGSEENAQEEKEVTKSFLPGEAVKISVNVSAVNPVGLVIIGVLALALIVLLIQTFIRTSRKYLEKKSEKPGGGEGKVPSPEEEPAPVYNFVDVDPDAVTKTIQLEEAESAEQWQAEKVKKKQRYDPYAQAREVLSGTHYGPPEKSRPVRQEAKAQEPARDEPSERHERTALCEHCGKQLRQKARFCTHCGKAVTQEETPAPSPAGTQECSVCGHRVLSQYAFCNKCGHKTKP